ncbi:MAG: WG repeat-containing protein, partial [Bacteroidales bacterium]|nr:WG repeat-containing protein [Bacteroidales bacterium]
MITLFCGKEQSIHNFTLIVLFFSITLFFSSCKGGDALNGIQSKEPVLFLATNLDGLCGFIDNTGKEVVPCQYEDAYDFSEGLAAVKNKNDLWGFIDETGKEVV